MASQTSIRAAGCLGTSLTGEDDEMLVRKAQSGSLVAFETLSSRYDRAVLALFLHLTASEGDALDLCRATFLAAYRALDRRKAESLYIWMYRLAAEQWLRWHAANASDQTLSRREQLVFTLKTREQLSLRTVAQIIGEPEDAVARTFSRAVAKLQAAIH